MLSDELKTLRCEIPQATPECLSEVRRKSY
jgi:hypothetical protein